MAFTLPFGFQRADGVTGLPAQSNGLQSGTAGTPSPSSSIVKSGNSATINGFVEEEPDSPEIERAEQATAQHRFKMLWNSALNYIQVLGRGTLITDGDGNRWRVLSSKIQSQRGGMATLSVTSEALSFDSPPDEFQVVPVELGVDILKHPRYFYALMPTVADTTTYVTTDNGTQISYADIKETIVRCIQTYRDSPVYPSEDRVNGIFQNSILANLKSYSYTVRVPNSNFTFAKKIADPVWWDGTAAGLLAITANCQYFLYNKSVNYSQPNNPIGIAFAAAKEMISKLWRCEDTPSVTGYEITWSQYYFAPIYLNPGNYIENPVGIVPYYFMSPNQVSGPTIFNRFTIINPQCFATNGIYGGPLGLSCLRKPDEVDYQRTWFKVTRKWLCSPVGHWDTDLFTTGNRPQITTDYHTEGFIS